jgi:DNA primase small subunit
VKEQSLHLLKQAFREYYFKNHASVEAPARMEEREFGYMQFANGMVRHLAFKNMNELQALLLREVPSDVYCSCAYYAAPMFPMQEKGFKGADLIFDIDVKELNLPCEREHEAWICNDCSSVMGEKSNCSSCNSAKVEHVSLPCDNCMSAGKREVNKLADLLKEDLGVSENEIRIYFSGNNGFHIHVYNNSIEPLDGASRSDIADYVSGNSLLAESFGVKKSMNAKGLNEIANKFPSHADHGWRGRVSRAMIRDEKEKGKVLRNLLKQGYTQFKIELERTARELGARIDPKVTMDVHRIFRMQGTLNSKSGLAKAFCGDIESFDPLADACLLNDELTDVHVRFSPKFRLKGNYYGPYKDQRLKLPAYAAVYLICKGLADA